MAALAASGIQLPTLTGYTPTLPKTQVTIADAALKGYWRFNGLDGGGSGTKDLSFSANHLTPISEQKNRQVGGSNISSRALKFFPGPLKNSDLGVQCSGIGYAGTVVTSPFSPAFAVSGQAFNTPQDGFSVGFLMAARATVGGTTAGTLLAYGIVGNNASNTTLDFNKSWAIVVDATSDIKMVMSVGGAGYYAESSTSANSGQMVCGTREAGTVANQTDGNRYNSFIYGNQKPPRLNFWSHYCWTYLPIEKELVCYVNGQEVDRRSAPINIDPLNGGPASGLKPIIPVNPAARMITFLQHQNAAPWDFTSTLSHTEDQQITDVFYFNRALTQNEVRYISQNGIDGATGTSTSGTLGGFITGANQVSGIIGGYNRGQDTVSGIIGGWNFGAFQASGMIGGYVSGISFFTAAPSGYFGGYIQGMDIVSGIIGGYIKGVGPASGIIGGFILGGLLAQMQFDGGFVVQAITAKDFDAQITLRKNTTSDFDAKLVIFQAEVGPDVDILVPDGTLNVASAPFNQYLVGLASGTQGKTIVQTRWTFGDLSSAVSVAESGAGLYPTQHHYAASGFYIAKFEAIDSNGIHGSATRIINAASGIDPVIVSLSGVPRSGTAALTVDFATAIDILPPGVSLTAKLLNFDDGQSSITLNPTHVYTEPGVYKPILIVRDSRGVIWCDSMEAGNDLLKGL
jgi:hypothetical protein